MYKSRHFKQNTFVKLNEDKFEIIISIFNVYCSMYCILRIYFFTCSFHFGVCADFHIGSLGGDVLHEY